jgi:hypothetical protein
MRCRGTQQHSTWTGITWRLALAALVSISLGLIKVLVLMIPRKRDADEKLDASAAVVPEDFLLVDVFAACFTIIPADDWYRTWAADRTIMLRMTAAEKLKLVFRQLVALSARSRITKLELFFDSVHTSPCTIKGQDVKRLAGVLAQCPAMAHLNLSEDLNPDSYLSPSIRSVRLGQRVFLEFWGNAQHWLTSISATMDIITPVVLEMSNQQSFEIPD